MTQKILILLLLVFALAAESCSPSKKGSSSSLKKGFDTASFDYIYIEGIRNKAMGNAGEAIKYFERAIEINPSSDGSFFQIAQLIGSLGDKQKAIYYARKAYDLDKTNEWYIAFLAGVFDEASQKDSALVYLEKLLTQNPDKESVRYSLATAYAEKGDYLKAEKLLMWFEEKYGTNETTTLVLIRSYMNTGKYQEAERKIFQLLETKPDEIFYNGLLAEIYRAQNKDREAIEIYNKLLDLNPDNPQTLLSVSDFFFSRSDFKDFFLTLGKVFMKDDISREDKIQIAAKLVENADTLKNWSKDVEINLMILEASYKSDLFIPLLRAEFFTRIGNNERAVSILQSAITANQQNYMAAESLMLLRAADGDNRKITEDGKTYSSMFNRSFLIKVIYAQGLVGNKNFSAAIEELRKAEILAGDDKEKTVQVLTVKGEAYYRMNNMAEAVAAFEKALELEPNSTIVLNNYAYYLAEMNMKTDYAVELAEKAISIERNNTYLDTYAWTLFKAGKIKAAMKIMEEIFENDGSDSEYFEHFGFMLEKKGDCQNAKKFWMKAVELDGSKEYLTNKIAECGK